MLLSALSSMCPPGSRSLRGLPHICVFLDESSSGACLGDADPRFLMTCSMLREWDTRVTYTRAGAGSPQGQDESAPSTLGVCTSPDQQHLGDTGGLMLCTGTGALF